MQQSTSQRENITHYSDAELSLRCYNEQELYKAMRASNGSVGLVRMAINGRFIYTKPQFKDLMQTVKLDLAESKRQAADSRRPRWLF